MSAIQGKNNGPGPHKFPLLLTKKKATSIKKLHFPVE
jgi:hypothetical protein